VLRGWDDERALEELGREYVGVLERADDDGRVTADEGREGEGVLTRDDGLEIERLEE